MQGLTLKLHLFSPTYGVDNKNLTFTNGAGHVAPTGETRNTQRVLMRKPERRRRRKWKDNINIMGEDGMNLCGPG